METFVHADYSIKVLQNFRRVLKPSVLLVLHEADFHWNSESLKDILQLSHSQNTLEEGSYENMLVETGFQEIVVEDLTDNVLHLWRLFAVLGAFPYQILRLLGLQQRFTNIMAGVEIYHHWGLGRYIAIRTVKGP